MRFWQALVIAQLAAALMGIDREDYSFWVHMLATSGLVGMSWVQWHLFARLFGTAAKAS